MCGIVGALRFDGNGFRVTEPYITTMRETVVHRGPDGGDTWVDDDGRVGLGFRRLAIIDLSDAAMQPMANEDGSIRLIFNGEIYNHAEIRAELEALGGHTWRTDHSDTEMIVHAFEQWGIDCIHRFRGMFALAIWDARAQELWLVRDRIGIKPLYFSVHHGRIVFGSEIKALLAGSRAGAGGRRGVVLPLPLLPDDAGAADALPRDQQAARRDVDADHRGRRDPRAALLGPARRTPSRSPACRRPRSPSGSSTSCARRCSCGRSRDVPVGVFLSGGIDSSTNAALFSEGEQDTVKTFSIGYEGEYESYQNELHYARQMAERVGAEHHERLLTVDDLLDFLPRMVQLQDEPIADPVCVPVYYVSKLARDNGVIVAQVGEGADELFWGYPTWKVYRNLQRYDDLPVPSVPEARRRRGGDADGQGRAARGRVPAPRRRRPADLLGRRRGVHAHAEAAAALAPACAASSTGSAPGTRSSRSASASTSRPGSARRSHWMSYMDLNLRLPELLLMRVDKMSMGVSLEGRVPFLDHKFVELALSIPEDVKTRNGELKHILKRAVRGVIPDELIDRPKQGFGVPVYEWFFDRLGDTRAASSRSSARRPTSSTATR